MSVWCGAGAETEGSATMFATCVRKISGIFWLTRPLRFHGEQDLVAELSWDDVPIVGGRLGVVFIDMVELRLSSGGA